MTGMVDIRAARHALRDLVEDDLSDAEVMSAYATAVWSTLTEPGDGVAGALIEQHGVVSALRWALAASPPTGVGDAGALDARELDAARRRWMPRRGAVDDALTAARRARVRLVTRADPAWPQQLDDLAAHAPLCLWLRGDPALLRTADLIAVVGARAASAYGAHVAMEIATSCAQAGVAVVSGAAYGIDAAAHRGALGVEGPTVAVLAGGVDRPYPAGHDELIARIASAGAVVSEVPCGTAPTKWRFLARNRVIAALAGATVVVEAAHRSGALNTAHHAAALGRPLGAVPGPITSATSAGCHRLLREVNAVCVTGGGDALEMLGHTGSGIAVGADSDDRTDDRTRVRDALSGRHARTTVEIARRAGMAPEEAAAFLGLLELDGVVDRGAAGWVRRGASTAPRLR